MKYKRIFLIVLDSFGIGNAPDADSFGDLGANTLKSISKSNKFTTSLICASVLYKISSISSATQTFLSPSFQYIKESTLAFSIPSKPPLSAAAKPPHRFRRSDR